MARFPSTEPDIAALAVVLIQGFRAAPEQFPTPPVPADALQASLDGRSPAKDEVEREQSLLRQLEVLDALLAKVQSRDPATDEAGSYTAELATAREVCDMVDALIEVRQIGDRG